MCIKLPKDKVVSGSDPRDVKTQKLVEWEP